MKISGKRHLCLYMRTRREEEDALTWLFDYSELPVNKIERSAHRTLGGARVWSNLWF